MFDDLITALGHMHCHQKDKKSDNLLIAKYHAHLSNAAQYYILTQFPLVNSSVRVVIATTFQLGHRHKGCATCAPLWAPAGLRGYEIDVPPGGHLYSAIHIETLWRICFQ